MQLASEHLVVVQGRPITLLTLIIAVLASKVGASTKHLVTGDLRFGAWIALNKNQHTMVYKNEAKTYPDPRNLCLDKAIDLRQASMLASCGCDRCRLLRKYTEVSKQEH
jgi:hypothetical protein